MGKRRDGFHDLETLFQTISLHDVLTFQRAARTTLTCDIPTIPTDESNLILRAAKALGAPPVAIDLQKRIPAGGGLGVAAPNASAPLGPPHPMFRLRLSPHALPPMTVTLRSP